MRELRAKMNICQSGWQTQELNNSAGNLGGPESCRFSGDAAAREARLGTKLGCAYIT